MAEEFPGLDLAGATFEPLGDEKATSETPDDSAPKRTRRQRSDAGVPRGSRSTGTTTTRKATTATVQKNIEDLFAKIAIAAAFTSPTASAVLMERGEATSAALIAIAQNHPRMMAALTKASQVGPASDLLQTLVMFGLALQVDTGRLPVEHPLANVTGVTNLYKRTHPVESDESGNGHFTRFTPPPGFGSASPITDPGHPLYSFTAGMSAANLNG